MRIAVGLAGALAVAAPLAAQQPDREAQVRRTVESFYAAFNNGFENAATFTTDDWNHINPLGGRTRGRDMVLKELIAVHSTFLKGVTDTLEGLDVRFASADVAVATATSRTSPFTTPEGVRHENEKQIRTFVVVKRGSRWLIMQDQNTFIAR